MAQTTRMTSRTIIDEPAKDRIVRSFVFVSRLLTCLLGVTLVLGLFGASSIAWIGLQDSSTTADVAVILGSKVEPSGRPSLRLAARLDRGAELYRDGLVPFLLVSGGTGVEGFSEGAVMRDYLLAKGIPRSNVIVDEHGDTTALTAQNSATLMRSHGLKSAIVVTQYFHVVRTKYALSQQGIVVAGSVHAHYFEARDVFSTIREVAALTVYWLAGASR